MVISPQQRTIINTTFKQISARADETANLFYQHLFELNPALKPLFSTDLTEQRRKFMQTFSMAVAALEIPDRLIPPLQALGYRHVRYGVKQEHYAIAGEALLWSISQILDTDFTPETREAWAAVYRMLADLAIGDAYDQPYPLT
jgi:hemoglobin-like flavoprotein